MIRLKWSFNVSNLNSFSAARPSDLLAGDFLARVVAEAHTRRKLAEAKQGGNSIGKKILTKILTENPHENPHELKFDEETCTNSFSVIFFVVTF